MAERMPGLLQHIEDLAFGAGPVILIIGAVVLGIALNVGRTLRQRAALDRSGSMQVNIVAFNFGGEDLKPHDGLRPIMAKLSLANGGPETVITGWDATVRFKDGTQAEVGQEAFATDAPDYPFERSAERLGEHRFDTLPNLVSRPTPIRHGAHLTGCVMLQLPQQSEAPSEPKAIAGLTIRCHDARGHVATGSLG